MFKKSQDEFMIMNNHTHGNGNRFGAAAGNKPQKLTQHHIADDHCISPQNAMKGCNSPRRVYSPRPFLNNHQNMNYGMGMSPKAMRSEALLMSNQINEDHLMNHEPVHDVTTSPFMNL